ncbi:ACT domain-containing protein [Shigella flexneri]
MKVTRRVFAGGSCRGDHRSGLLRDITTILANEKVNVLGVASRSDTKQQLATIDMTIEIYNLQVLGRVLGKLNQVTGCDR